jgi:CRP-like cAMP-binding protein
LDNVATFLIRKLEQFAELSAEEKRALHDAARLKLRDIAPREDISREGEAPGPVKLILHGFAARYKTLPDGRRQIVGFLLPGDLCDARMQLLREMDHSIGAISAVTVAEIPEDVLAALADKFVGLRRAFLWNALVEEAIAREWTLNLGRRDALERMAHLFCEIFARLRAVGLTNGDTCELPVNQAELADALGLSHVHTNRTLQELRSRGLVIFKGKHFEIRDVPGLEDIALFNPNYLHFQGPTPIPAASKE